MEPPREDPLMLLRGSWVEVAPFGAPDPSATPGEEEEEEEEEEEGGGDPLEAILREAQMEASSAAEQQQQQQQPPPPPRGDGAPKGPSEEEEEEDRSPAGKREELERPGPCAPLDWPRLPPKELGCAVGPPPCGPRSLARKRGLRDPQVMLLVAPSLLLSHVLALGLGICLGKRLAASSSSSI